MPTRAERERAPALTSPDGQSASVDELAQIRASLPGLPPPKPFTPAAPRRTGVNEDVMRDLLMQAQRGPRILPADPIAAEVARQLWAEYDAIKAAGQTPDIPMESPDL